MKINLSNLSGSLSREQMKNVVGGVEATCGWSGGGSGYPSCGITKEQALRFYNEGGGGNWCCDSCPTTTYCGNGSGNQS
jgi:natural product precursor